MAVFGLIDNLFSMRVLGAASGESLKVKGA